MTAETKSLRDVPDPGSFGGHPYSERERALGYGTDYDPRFANAYDIAEALMASQKRAAAYRYALWLISQARFSKWGKIAREALDE